MRIFLVGEAAEHAHDLVPHLHEPLDVVALSVEAASSAVHDHRIEPDDVVVSLRFARGGAQAPPFRLLHVPGAGLDAIDLDAIAPETAVANVYEHETPIAEYVLARLLEWEIRAGEMRAAFGPEAWPDLYRDRVPHGEIRGRTLGLIGYGRIGRAIASRAAAFGVHVVAVDDMAEGDEAAKVLPTVHLPEVLASADYVVIACPLTPSTTGLIDAAALRRMPDHGVLVNISRAEIVDEDALYEALRSHGIGGAVLDVWYRYPRSSDDRGAPASRPFWDLPNAWCTPHSSAWTRELSQRRYAVVADNINRLLAGQPLRNTVRSGDPGRGRTGSAQGGAHHGHGRRI